jgi:uncharacterized protein
VFGTLRRLIAVTTVAASLSTAMLATSAGAATITPADAAAAGFRIHNVKSGKCIGISSGNAGDWTCTTNPDQTWHWYVTSAWDDQMLLLQNGNDQCLASKNLGDGDGDAVYAENCDAGDVSQAWDEVAASTGIYLQDYFGYVIGVNGGSTANGAQLIMWDQLSHSDQYWEFY